MNISLFQAKYWKTLMKLSPSGQAVHLRDDTLCLSNYPFQPASIFPEGVVGAEQVVEVILGYPCQVRLKKGDILFVPHSEKEILLRFVHLHSLRVKERKSIWCELLEPFLDTWIEEENIERQFEWFASLGIDRSKIEEIREEVSDSMYAYNFGTGLWEWNHLDLFDVLSAQSDRLGHDEFRDFYQRAIDLAWLDPEVEVNSRTANISFSESLFALLLEWYPRKESRDAARVHHDLDERLKRIEEYHRQLFSRLNSVYTDPQRKYHNKQHIEHCLAELNRVWSHAVYLNEIRWAIIFHDAIYDVRGDDNEVQSARWAVEIMKELKRPAEEQRRVFDLILATSHKSEVRTVDEALLVDIDLSTLGADRETFEQYDRTIRAEYHWVPSGLYREARREVLESFLLRDRIYQTSSFGYAYERKARKNIMRALAEIDKQEY